MHMRTDDKTNACAHCVLALTSMHCQSPSLQGRGNESKFRFSLSFICIPLCSVLFLIICVTRPSVTPFFCWKGAFSRPTTTSVKSTITTTFYHSYHLPFKHVPLFFSAFACARTCYVDGRQTARTCIYGEMCLRIAITCSLCSVTAPSCSLVSFQVSRHTAFANVTSVHVVWAPLRPPLFLSSRNATTIYSVCAVSV